jgi:hypothetical protein
MHNTSAREYVLLKIILLVLSILEIAAGLLLLFGAVPLSTLIPATLQLLPALATMLLMVFGVVAIGFGYLIYLASRNPVRYVGVLDALTFLLIAGALLGLYVTFALHALGGPVAWVGAVARVALAVILLALRPRGVSSAG